jgi:prepilin-type N-terminal cleavage/methylation domain-containing protein/prepilin-type processing-associated H-X9-DG protein
MRDGRGFSRERAGFTLVELLVVIAILALLGGLSLPVLTSVLARARTSACQHNLRVIGQGLLSFAADNDGALPESGAAIPYNTVDATTGKQGWTQQIEPYMGGTSTAVYRCPDSSRVLPQNATYSYFSGAHAAYAEAHGFAAVRLTKMHALSRHILAGDIAFPDFSPDDCDKDDYTQDPAFNGNSGTIPIHQGSVNIVFADGHIENVKSFDQTSMTTVYPGLGYDYLWVSP